MVVANATCVCHNNVANGHCVLPTTGGFIFALTKYKYNLTRHGNCII